MIHAKTARKLLYDYHGGQWSTFYAAASSGLVESIDALIQSANEIKSPRDRLNLAEWLTDQQIKNRKTTINGQEFLILPWYEEC